MFCEAVCCYGLPVVDKPSRAITCPVVAPLDQPHYEDEYLFGTGREISIYEGISRGKPTSVVIKYKEAVNLPAVPVAFRMVRIGQEVAAAGTDCVVIKGVAYAFEQFDSLYEICELNLQDGILAGTIQRKDQDAGSVMKEIERSGGRLEMIDGVYTKERSSEPVRTVYTIEAAEKKIRVDASLIAIPNACNDSPRSSENITREEGIAYIDMASVDIISEHSNKSDYVSLIKNLLKSVCIKNRSTIIHMYINKEAPLFITVFYIVDCKSIYITAFLTRKHMNLIRLYNHLTALPMLTPKILSIPNIPSRAFILSANGTNLLVPYTLAGYDTDDIVISIREGSNVVLVHTPHSFWIIMWALSRLQPLVSVGLVMVPVTEDTEYLLNGPYNFIISTLREITETKIQNVKYTLHSPVTDGTAPTSDAGVPNMHHYASHLQLSKLSAAIKFPLHFGEPQCPQIEEIYLNRPTTVECSYLYDTERGLVFLPRPYIDAEDPLPLWILCFEGQLDSDALLLHSDNLCPYVAQRACMDENRGMLQQAIRHARASSNKVLLETLQRTATYSIKRPDISGHISQIKSIFLSSMCECGHEVQLQSSSFSEVIDGIEFNIVNHTCSNTACRRYTIMCCDGVTQMLISVQNILALINSNRPTEQFICSLVAYFYYHNLPWSDNATLLNSKYSFNVTY